MHILVCCLGIRSVLLSSRADVSLQVLPHMVEAGEGTIIYTGATASLRGSVGFVPLAVPKFALRGLVQSIAREFQPKVWLWSHSYSATDPQHCSPTGQVPHCNKPTRAAVIAGYPCQPCLD